MRTRFWGIAIFLLCVLQGTNAAVYNGTCGDNVQWRLNTADGILHLTGTGRMYDYTYDTRAPWHPYNDQIRRVDIANTVTRIGNYAFNGYSTIDSVQFGGVRTIGSQAMNNMQGLTSVYIPMLDTLEENSMSSNGSLLNVRMGNHLKYVADYALVWNSNMQMLHLGDSVVYVGHQGADGCNSLDSLYLGRCLKNIGSYAFRSCYNLQHVNFPATLETIGYESFTDAGLVSLHIPVGTRDISSTAFRNNSALLSITVDPANTTFDSRQSCNAVCRTNDHFLLRGCRNTTIVSSLTSIGEYAFSGTAAMTSVVIPNTITSVGSYAFENCGLTSTTFPNSITLCGDAPFNGCHGLTTPVYNNTYFAHLPYSYSGAYTFPTGPSVIVGHCCVDRDLLTAAYIPDGYTSIGYQAFTYCDLLDTVSIGEGLTYLPEYCFMDCRMLRGTHLPNSLKEIRYYAFSGCSNLRRIVIPDAVEVIGPQAFANCSSLQFISIPAALQRFESWGSSTFQGCTSLNHVYWNARTLDNPTAAPRAPFYDVRSQITQFELGDSVRYVPNYLCYEMTSLRHIAIGENVVKIGTMTNLETTGNVFYNCSSVTSIDWNARNVESALMYDYAPFYTFRENVTSFTLGDSVRVIPNYLCFGMNHLTTLRIPKNVFHIGDFAFRLANGLTGITVDAANTTFDSRQNCNAVIEKATNTLLLGCANTVIPASVQAIGECAFRNVVNLRTLNIPTSVKSVGREAFNGCTSLTSISLPRGVTAVADYTFQDCESLQIVSLPTGLTKVGIRAFSGCAALPTITMPASLTSIDKEAFDKTQMTGMTMLSSTPPAVTLTSLPDACPITIPCDAIEAYRNAPVWESLGTRLSAQYAYNITVSANNTLWGTTTINRTSCDEVVLEALPSHGFHFVEWQTPAGVQVSAANPYTLSLTSNTQLIAFFQAGAAPAGSAAHIQVRNREVQVETAEPTEWRLVNLQGQPVAYAEGESVSLTAPAGGMYILQSAGETHKIYIR